MTIEEKLSFDNLEAVQALINKLDQQNALKRKDVEIAERKEMMTAAQTDSNVKLREQVENLLDYLRGQALMQDAQLDFQVAMSERMERFERLLSGVLYRALSPEELNRGKMKLDKELSDRDLLRHHKRTMAALQLQKAKWGSLSAPVHLTTSIEDLEQTIAELDSQINQSERDIDQP